MQHESQTRDNKSCSTSTHYRQRTSKARIDRSSPRDLQRRSTSREREKGEGGRRRRKMARGGRTTARARSHCLSRISHPSEFSGSEEKHEETIDREVDEREKERRRKKEKRANLRNGSSREKAGSLYHAATTTGLQKQTPHLLC